MSNNQMHVRGYLGSKPELNKTENGIVYAVASIATQKENLEFGGAPKPQWHKVIVWGGSRAEKFASEFDKGNYVNIQGSIKGLPIVHQEGERIQRYAIHARQFQHANLEDPSLNKVTLRGRLGKDPELKITGNGTVFAIASLASQELYRDKEGLMKTTKPEWHKIVVWDKEAAQSLKDSFKKGSLLEVHGTMHNSAYKNEKDEKVRAYSVYATDVTPFRGRNHSQEVERKNIEPKMKPSVQENNAHEINI